MDGAELVAVAEAWYQCLRGIATDNPRYSRISRPGPPISGKAEYRGGIPAPHAGPVSSWLEANPKHKEAVWAFAVLNQTTKCRDYIRWVDSNARLGIKDIRRFFAFATASTEPRLVGSVRNIRETWYTPVGGMIASQLIAELAAMPGWNKFYRPILHGEITNAVLFPPGRKGTRPTSLQAAMLTLAKKYHTAKRRHR